eukprot:CAMPEP_0174382102 /NCGR_PEP_ID=MMETSP0811_2-20130205/124410_1 /TAXON_ID=73025 ORGANISM="Eutreptiella gymnastica-like, Strain CCMP1594" /NCGR_SAMPLE_ID=MMETSP0811_2 /ASSEMBLY_ACC=CAM_ASM_000667 /LENGTH=179 /DNA_ID=CAMNT_0015535375 /DNA_START=867 /DNA_END=1403 /DNA_ORIENTATION=+
MTSGCQMSRMILTSRQTSAVPWDKGASWTGGHQQRLDVWCCLFVEEVPRCAMSPAVRVGAGARDASRNGGARLERESGTAPSDNGSPLSVVRSPTVTRRTGSHYKRPSMCRVDSMEFGQINNVGQTGEELQLLLAIRMESGSATGAVKFFIDTSTGDPYQTTPSPSLGSIQVTRMISMP